MVSPTAAPRMAAAMAAPSGTRWLKANTPPSSTATSPGNTKPRKADDSSAGSTKITARAGHPWRARIQSATCWTMAMRPRAIRSGDRTRSRRSRLLEEAGEDVGHRPRVPAGCRSGVPGQAVEHGGEALGMRLVDDGHGSGELARLPGLVVRRVDDDRGAGSRLQQVGQQLPAGHAEEA